MASIHNWAYDVEVLPNFFSVTFVDMDDYFRVFNDCCEVKIKKDKEVRTPIPLTEKLTVAEIKYRLSKVKTVSFYITDYDNSQHLPLLAFINNLVITPTTKVYNWLYGFNSASYDKLMIACFLMYSGICKTTKDLCKKLYETSKQIIKLQDDKEAFFHDYYIQSLVKYNLPYKDIDLMKIFALNKVGTMTNSKGEKIYYGKSLKQTSINIKWYELLEYELPPINDFDKDLYTSLPRYSGLTLDELNSLIEKWDRYMIPEYEADMMYYNKNDVFIVCEIARLYADEIKLRYNISKSYGVDVMNSSRSDVANKLFIKFYSEFSGLRPEQWRGKHTDRTVMSFKRVIFDNIRFKTKKMQDFLDDIKTVAITSLGKDSFNKSVTINNTTYTMATGGLHSEDAPRELKSVIKLKDGIPSLQGVSDNVWDAVTDDSYFYVHWDISSFYPSIMGKYKVAPEHMDQNVYAKLVLWIRDTRISAKHSTEEIIDGIPKDILAQALKIVINSIYGKMGQEKSDICDRLAVLKVTINGQLFILMLCEELELNNIEVVSANTDGIVVKVYKRDKEKFDEIANHWQEYTQLSADSQVYLSYIDRDINNYFAEEVNGSIEYKGDYNPNIYKEDLKKGYSMPIVTKAVINYFTKDIPVLETLYNETDILAFCTTQNIGRKFHIEFYQYANKFILQRQIRYYASKSGGNLFKVDEEGKLNNLCDGYKVRILNSLDDVSISERDIDYQYYYTQALKLIDPIKLGISPNQKANATSKSKSGKSLISKYSGCYDSLFDNVEDEIYNSE